MTDSKLSTLNSQEDYNNLLLSQQKLASLGLLSAGIAHEIQNPLNFVINFSKMSEKLLGDMKEIVEDVRGQISEDDADELDDITSNLTVNIQKIREHGERAVSIIQGILLISRGKEGELRMESALLCRRYGHRPGQSPGLSCSRGVFRTVRCGCSFRTLPF